MDIRADGAALTKSIDHVWAL